MTKTLTPPPGISTPPAAPEPGPRPLRLATVCVAFIVLTVLAGAAVLPTVLGFVGVHISAADGAIIALAAWVPSAIYVGARCIGLLWARLQRDRLSSSAVARESL